MALQTRPEPMNASPHHSKVKVSLTLGNSIFVAGEHVSGKMEVECRAERGLGINVMMVELFAIQELTSRDHSATSTFLHSRRLFQGPGLPPSNAVQPYPLPGDPPIPRDYHQARRGLSTFLFRFPIPSSSPSSLSFGGGLARVRYEVRASAGVFWKGERRLVTDKKEIDVVESFEEDFERVEPEGVIVGEHGKIWAHGRIVGGVAVAGESACVELQVKNHSSKKNTGLSITLTRMLHLPPSEQPPLQISDTLTTVAFRGPAYIIPPGAEGVASLVFDIPKHARGVKGGTREGDEGEVLHSEPLFEVRCIVIVKMTMGIGSKDIILNLPVTILHPAALPQPPPSPSYPYISSAQEIAAPPVPPMSPVPFADPPQSPYVYSAPPMSPPLLPYMDQGHVWLPPPAQTPNPYQFISSPIQGQQYFPQQPILLPPFAPLPRPSSAGAYTAHLSAQQPLLPLEPSIQQLGEPEEGKGERASRISQNLRFSSRNRSASPQSHRFPFPVNHPSSEAIATLQNSPPSTSDIVGLPIPIGVVHSPRPFLSPKQSYSPIHNTLSKSERVEELERMAEEVAAQNENLSVDIPKALKESTYSDKTLPLPPVPSGKGKRQSPLTTVRPPIDVIFEAIDPSPSDKAPPTPTLTAITPLKQPRMADLSGLGQSESGLDALERRLLAEVGTRKLDFERRPDVRTVLPISIPQSNADVEPLHDSAISSLTLAEHDSDERTHMAGKSSMSEDDKEIREGGSGTKAREKKKGEALVSAERSEERKKGKKKERRRDGEAHRFKRSSRGRVAAWLDEIHRDVPPPETPSSPEMSKLLVDIPATPIKPEFDFEPFQVVPRPPRDTRDDSTGGDVLSAPNPRSSGFVPIGTLKKDGFKRHPALRGASPHNKTPEGRKGHPDISSPSAEPQSEPTPPPVPPRTTRAARMAGELSPPQVGLVNGHVNFATRRTKPPSAPPDLAVPTTGAKVFPRLPVFPPPPRSEPEIKYDVRSARGGRGGRVATVASIWATGAAQQNSADADAKGKGRVMGQKPHSVPAVKPLRAVGKSPLSGVDSSATALAEAPQWVDLSGKRTRPIVKSASVPAIISSSHATPMLSSTASLARAAPGYKVVSPVKVLPSTLPELPSQIDKPPVTTRSPGTKSPPSDLAFGKARLRDLIRKYQEHAT